MNNKAELPKRKETYPLLAALAAWGLAVLIAVQTGV